MKYWDNNYCQKDCCSSSMPANTWNNNYCNNDYDNKPYDMNDPNHYYCHKCHCGNYINRDNQDDNYCDNRYTDDYFNIEEQDDSQEIYECSYWDMDAMNTDGNENYNDNYSNDCYYNDADNDHEDWCNNYWYNAETNLADNSQQNNWTSNDGHNKAMDYKQLYNDNYVDNSYVDDSYDGYNDLTTHREGNEGCGYNPADYRDSKPIHHANPNKCKKCSTTYFNRLVDNYSAIATVVDAEYNQALEGLQGVVGQLQDALDKVNQLSIIGTQIDEWLEKCEGTFPTNLPPCKCNRLRNKLHRLFDEIVDLDQETTFLAEQALDKLEASRELDKKLAYVKQKVAENCYPKSITSTSCECHSNRKQDYQKNNR